MPFGVCDLHRKQKKGVCADCLGCKLCPALDECRTKLEHERSTHGGWRHGKDRNEIIVSRPSRHRRCKEIRTNGQDE